MQTRRQAFEAMDDAERDVRFRELLGRKLNPDAFRQEATRLLGKAPQEVVLKTGETILGSVFGENGNYKIYTARGVVILRPEDIEEIRFQ